VIGGTNLARDVPGLDGEIARAVQADESTQDYFLPGDPSIGTMMWA
jgi:hypothetical protein